MIRFKIDVLKELKKAGYNTTALRQNKIISEGTVQKLRANDGAPVSTATINTICRILKKQPGALLEFIPDTDPAPDQEK